MDEPTELSAMRRESQERLRASIDWTARLHRIRSRNLGFVVFDTVIGMLNFVVGNCLIGFVMLALGFLMVHFISKTIESERAWSELRDRCIDAISRIDALSRAMGDARRLQ